MPRPRLDTPVPRLHRPSGQAIVTLDGRDVYLGTHGSPEAEIAYERELAAWRAHGVQPQKRGAAARTVAEVVLAFWRHVDREGLYTKNGRKTSERACMRVALRPVVRLFGNDPADTFGPLDLVTVRKALCSPQPPPREGERRRRVHVGPIVRSSVNKHLHRIRRVFRWAVAMELVPASVLAGLLAVEPIRRGQNVGTREGRRVLPARLRSVAATLRRVSEPVAAMIRLQWLTGARPGEIVQMRLGDVDRSGPVWIYRPGSHKTEHHDIAREIMLGPKAQRVLAPFLSLNLAAYLFPGRGRKRDRLHVTEAAYCKAITRACADEPRIPHWTPAQLRHNAGTRFRQHRGIEAAQNMLGHQDAGTTLIYAERNRRAAIEIAQRLG